MQSRTSSKAPGAVDPITPSSVEGPESADQAPAASSRSSYPHRKSSNWLQGDRDDIARTFSPAAFGI